MNDDAAARKARVRDIFNQIAPDYDLAGPGCFAHFGRRLVELAGVEPGQRVLDIATGRGAVLFAAAERAGAAGELVGIDLAEDMARMTSDEAARRGLNVQVRVMDAEQLDFPDAGFDRVLCGFGVMFLPDLPRALAEFRRVLKPGGRLAVSTWRASQGADLGAVLAQLDLLHVSGDAALQYMEPDSVTRPLVAAGFRDVRVLVDEAIFRYADVEQYWQNSYGTGMRSRLDKLEAAQIARAKAALAERLEVYRRPDGLHVAATALLAVATR